MRRTTDHRGGRAPGTAGSRGRGAGAGTDAGAPRGLTLVELLLVIAIIGVLVAMLLPAIGGMIGRSRQFACQFDLRGITTEFRLFADPALGPDRGLDTGSTFRLETFQRSLYGVGEFRRDRWGGEVEEVALDDRNSLVTCPSVSGTLIANASIPDGNLDDLVYPEPAVSYGFNARLHRRPAMLGDEPVLRPVNLNDNILVRGEVPLVLEASGGEAEAMNRDPFWIAPPIDPDDAYGDGGHWYPGPRHRGRLNVAFIDGHVTATEDPLDLPGAAWGFAPSY